MKKGLGKGLEALFSDNEVSVEQKNITKIKISQIEPNRLQPRKNFDEEKIKELSLSIKEHGIIQPIVVRDMGNDFYQIIAGERRWRAARLAGLNEVDVVIKEYDDKKAMEVALVENLQRENLNPVEESLGYKSLIDEYGYNQEEVANIVTKSRPAIANSLRLLSLPEDVLEYIKSEKLSSGHGRALLGLKNKEDISNTADILIKNNLSVREAERLVNKLNSDKKSEKKENIYIKEIEKDLSSVLGRKIIISHSNKKGRISIEYYGNDDLNDLINVLKKNNK